MEEYRHEAKIAIVRLLEDILNADGIVQKSEENYLTDVATALGLDCECRWAAKTVSTEQAMETVGGLTARQKSEIAKMMGRMIVADNDINYNEVMLYNKICDTCGIENEFQPDDYPEATLSGFEVREEAEPEF